MLTRTLNEERTMERSYSVFESLGFVPPTAMGSPARAPSPTSSSLSSLASLNASSKKAPLPKPTVDYSAVDEDKMMTHILDCLAALGHAQRHRVDCSHAEDSATAEVLAARDRVFKAALGVMVAALVPVDSEAAIAHDINGSGNGRNVYLVLQAFPDASKQVRHARRLPSIHLSLFSFFRVFVFLAARRAVMATVALGRGARHR